MENPVAAPPPTVEREVTALRRVEAELRKVLVGQDELVERLLVGLLTRGHLLLEGVPGLAKTLAVKTLARTLALDFKRIQFTPDLLPADLVGTLIFDPKRAEFQPHKGPLFTHILLADEINRAPAKVQSALLEAMQERQVTLAGDTRRLPDPFLVLATQNPVEQEGTYALPEAQVDRFMVKLVVGYPNKQEEMRIIDRMAGLTAQHQVQQATTPEELLRMRALLDTIYLDDKVKSYIVDLVFATREPEQVGLAKLKPLILYGASPRASLALARASRARAFLEGRGFVTPQDVKAVGLMVMRHRVLTTYEAEAEGVSSEQVLQTVFDTVKVP
ncbi:MAG: MoxR family ATPase [Thermoanaerobaculia bacterium]|nr:MoxR family ATPase [Thermoanaerobaculia bacterium]